MTSSISLSSIRSCEESDSISHFNEPLSRYTFAPAIRCAYIQPDATRRNSAYSNGLLGSFSVLFHTHGLRLGAEKSLGQLFEDIERYTHQLIQVDGFDSFALFSIDDVDLARTQSWNIHTYQLAAKPDDTLPHFPEEDFEG